MKSLLGVPSVFFIGALSLSSTTAQAQSCKVDVTSPKVGDTVGVKAQIVGTATVPSGLYLWVFARKEGQRKWWPQGGGDAEVNPKSGRWVSDGTFGDEGNLAKDAGATFEITAVVVDAAAHKDLTNYVETTEKANPPTYPGTQLPAAAPTGCAIKENVTVKRR